MNTRFLVAVVIVLVMLVGAFFAFKPHRTQTTASTQPTTRVYVLVVKDRKLVSGPQTLTVNQNDEVVIRIAADEDEELHLHGYDKVVDLAKDVPAELRVKATLTGNFPYELEHSKTEIGSLQVQPR